MQKTFIEEYVGNTDFREELKTDVEKALDNHGVFLGQNAIDKLKQTDFEGLDNAPINEVDNQWGDKRDGGFN